MWKARLLPSKKIPAGSSSVWMIDIIAGETIKKGGKIRLLPNYSKHRDWIIGEFYFSADAQCNIENHLIFNGPSRNPILEGVVTKGLIKKGRRICITLGNYSGSGPETFAPRVVCSDGCMALQVSTGPDQKPVFVSEIPFEIIPAKKKIINLNFLSPTDRYSPAIISIVDEFSNHINSFEGEVRLFTCYYGKEKEIGKVLLQRGYTTYYIKSNIKDNSPCLLRAESIDGTISSGQAPYFPGFLQDIGQNIYFGDMHLHCGSGDGLHNPDWVYRYARDIVGLSFTSITDHSFLLSRGDVWKQQMSAAHRANKSGRFITFPGYEYDGCYYKGHIGVHFKDYFPPIISASSYEELWEKLKCSGYEFFTIPHHPNTEAEHYPLEHLDLWKPYDWDYHDEEVQPLMEIFQERGSFETEEIGNGVIQGGFGSSFRSALARGYHIGCCGGSDTHLGRPGTPSPTGWRLKCGEVRAGLTAVIAKNLTRDSLWFGLTNRHTYATSGVRILVDARFNNLIMGSRITVTEKIPVSIRVRGVGTCRIETVTVIRNGRILREFHPHSEYFDVHMQDNHPDFTVPCFGGIKKARHTYYYVRIIQEDGHLAWTSPVFFCMNT